MGAIAVSAVTDPGPVISLPTSGNTQPVINPVATTQSPVTDQLDLSPQAAQLQPAQSKVQYANPEVLGTQAVTTYMVNGQIYTRYRDEVTNKVTYIPDEAQVLPGGGSGSAPPAINITA